MRQAGFLESRQPPAHHAPRGRHRKHDERRNHHESQNHRRQPEERPRRGRGAVLSDGFQTWPDQSAEQVAEKAREQEGTAQHNHRINHQAFEPRPEIVPALVMVRQQRQHTGQIVALRADFEQALIQFRQPARARRLAQGRALGEAGFERL